MGTEVDESVRAPEDSRPSIRHFSLMNSLLAVVNRSPHDSMDSTLARYFLERFDRLADLNVYDVAEECYTSRSGIRRFCQSIGLDNFSDLKSYAWEWSRHRRLFSRYTDHENYRDYLVAALAEMDRTINEAVSEETLDRLARLLHRSKRIVILTSDFSSGAVRQFQQSMLYLHKVIDIVTDSTGDTTQLDVGRRRRPRRHLGARKLRTCCSHCSRGFTGRERARHCRCRWRDHGELCICRSPLSGAGNGGTHRVRAVRDYLSPRSSLQPILCSLWRFRARSVRLGSKSRTPCREGSVI